MTAKTAGHAERNVRLMRVLVGVATFLAAGTFLYVTFFGGAK